MYGTIGWSVLGALCVFIELYARLHPTRTVTIGRVGSWLAGRGAGRLALALVWVFVGVHLFTRYTVPGHGS